MRSISGAASMRVPATFSDGAELKAVFVLLGIKGIVRSISGI